MNNLVLALIYKMYGFGSGEVTKLGDGLPSNATQNNCGFAWPIGTEFKFRGYTFRADEEAMTQLD